MGLPARLLLLTAACLLPAVFGQVLIASGNLPALIAVPGSIAAALILAGLVGRSLIATPLRAQIREVGRALDRPRVEAASEFDFLTAAAREIREERERLQDQHRQDVELIEASLAERTRALSECNDFLQVARAESLRAPAWNGQVERQRLTGQLAGGVAHDFNNLLATVLGCLELIERRADDPERLQALIKRASDAVERAAKLTSGLVHFARRQSQARKPTDINALVGDVAPLIVSALGRRVRLRTTLAPRLCSAVVDPAGVEVALVGICLGARVANAEAGPLTVVIGTEASLPEAVIPPPSHTPHMALTVTVENAALCEIAIAQARTSAESAGASMRLTEDGGMGARVALAMPCTDWIGDVMQLRAGAP